MLVGSWVVNSAELDMAEQYYPELDRVLKAKRVDTKFYNSDDLPTSTAAPTHDEQLEIENVFTAKAHPKAGLAVAPGYNFSGEMQIDEPMSGPDDEDFAAILARGSECRRAFACLQDIADTIDEDTMEERGLDKQRYGTARAAASAAASD
ncbi:uncharacterized protein RHO25_006522 [Cercospora beticola]|uniref:Uncharacterized protein n=1 Tax=Cercospora beticola TaxID=122368 RepID=A0ABZ0NQQ7_CERBT|nr:hypothetical protein RHO25_006522 [Cercospora beticola]